MWRRLLEDPAFCNAVKSRYMELRQGILSEDSIDLFLDHYAALLDEAKDRQLKKYKEVLKSNNPWDWGPTSFFAAYRVSSYAEEIAMVKNWFRQRLAFLDQNLPGENVESSLPHLQYYDVDLQVGNRSAIVTSPRPLVRVDVVNAAGTRLRTLHPASAHTVEVPLDTLPPGMQILVCYSADGSMISKSVCR